MNMGSSILELLNRVEGVLGSIPCPVISLIPPFLRQTSHFVLVSIYVIKRLAMEYVLSKPGIFYSRRNDKDSVGIEIRNLPAL